MKRGYKYAQEEGIHWHSRVFYPSEIKYLPIQNKNQKVVFGQVCGITSPNVGHICWTFFISLINKRYKRLFSFQEQDFSFHFNWIMKCLDSGWQPLLILLGSVRLKWILFREKKLKSQICSQVVLHLAFNLFKNMWFF